MNAFYTAKLASFLTIEKQVSLVNEVKDLFNPAPGVQYGAKATGSTIMFFKESKNPEYNKMFEKMNSTKDLPLDNVEGRERAKKGKYAFLMESSTIEYIVERHCEVVQIGYPLDEKGYGIAMKKSKNLFPESLTVMFCNFIFHRLDSPYHGILSAAVLQLHESGELSRMKTKWWKEKNGGGKCDVRCSLKGRNF